MSFPTLIDYSPTANNATAYNTTSGCISVTSSQYNPVSYMIKKPYLVWQLDDTTMKINWQLDRTSTCRISYGTDTTYGLGSHTTTETGSGTNEHQHSYTLTNLTPGTKYYYKIQDRGVYYGEFVAPNSSDDDSYFFAIGDTQGTPLKHFNFMSKKMYQIVASGTPYNFVFHAGDWSDTDTEENIQENFFDPDYYYSNKIRSNIPFIGVRGNHDNTDGAVTYHKYWDFNYVTPFYMYFDNGPVRHILVDAYGTITPGSSQYNWLESTISGSTKPWNIIWVHTPIFTDNGGHGSNTTLRGNIGPLLASGITQLVIGGHNHFYSRCTVSGITHITTGGAGASLYTPTYSGTGLDITVQDWHFLEFYATTSGLTCNARSWDDYALIDTFTLVASGIQSEEEEPEEFNNVYSTYFAGTDDYGIVSDSRSLDFGRNDFGISFWARIDGTPATYQSLVSKINDYNSSSGGKGWSVYVNTSGRVCIKISDTENSTLTEYSTKTTDYRDGNWHHFIFNYYFATNTASYFIDGVAQDSDVTSAFAGNFDSTYPLMVGMGWNKGATKDLALTGYVDEISIHNSPIDQAKATSMYNNGKPVDLSEDNTLMAWWRMGDGDTYPNITDHGPNNLTMTVYNMTSESIVSTVP